MNIKVNFDQKFLQLDGNFTNKIKEKFNHYKKPWVCFGVDSTEVNRIWPQKNFSDLADSLMKKNLVGTIFCVFEYVNDEQLKDGSDVSQSELLKLIDTLNRDNSIDGYV